LLPSSGCGGFAYNYARIAETGCCGQYYPGMAKPEGTFVLSPSAEVVSFRTEDAQISEAMSQFINDDVVVDLNLEHETSLL
jgi:hypothetical protein